MTALHLVGHRESLGGLPPDVSDEDLHEVLEAGAFVGGQQCPGGPTPFDRPPPCLGEGLIECALATTRPSRGDHPGPVTNSWWRPGCAARRCVLAGTSTRCDPRPERRRRPGAGTAATTAASRVALVAGRVHHPVRSRRVVAAAGQLQHVAAVDGDAAEVARHVVPVAVHVAHLQAGLVRRGQHRQQVDVLVGCRPDGAGQFVAAQRRVAQHAQQRALAAVHHLVERSREACR